MENWLHRSGHSDPLDASAETNHGRQLRGAVREVTLVGWAVIDFEPTGTIYPPNRVIEIGVILCALEEPNADPR